MKTPEERGNDDSDIVCRPKIIRRTFGRQRYSSNNESENPRYKKCPFTIVNPGYSKKTNLDIYSFEEIEEDFKLMKYRSYVGRFGKDSEYFLRESTQPGNSEDENADVENADVENSEAEENERPINPFFKNFEEEDH